MRFSYPRWRKGSIQVVKIAKSIVSWHERFCLFKKLAVMKGGREREREYYLKVW